MKYYWIERKTFRWILDDDGDIGLCFFNIFTLIKYKHAVIFVWGGGKFEDAPKYLYG